MRLVHILAHEISHQAENFLPRKALLFFRCHMFSELFDLKIEEFGC